MKKGMKKFWSWALVILMLLTSVLSPMGQVWAAKTVGSLDYYEDLTDAWYDIQIADACFNKRNLLVNDVKVNLANNDSSERDKLEQFMGFNSGYDYGFKSYTSPNVFSDIDIFRPATNLYDSYLEKTQEGRIDNGSIWCENLKKNVVNELLKRYNKEPVDLVCGGLFIIKTGWGDNLQNGYNGAKVPKGWSDPNDNSNSNNCREFYERFENTISDGAVVSERYGGTAGFVVKFEINDNFSFEDFFGVSDEFEKNKDKMKEIVDYRNFKSVCGPEYLTEAEYQRQKELGYGNLFTIYSAQDGLQYIKLNDPSKTVYSNGDLKANARTTCASLATKMKIQNSSLKEDVAKIESQNCKQVAKTNLDTMGTALLNYQRALDIISRALNSANGNVQTLLNDDEKKELLAYVSRAGNSFALETLANHVIAFDMPLKEIKEIYNDASESYDDAKVLYNSAKAEYKDETSNGLTYSLNDSGEVECTLNKSMEGYIDQIGGIIGGSIDFNDYTRIDLTDYDANDSNTTDVCYGHSGSLGWILCPVVEAVNGIGEYMWDKVKVYLSIPASETFKSGGGVETGWGVVRNIANIAFIILFLVVIFSQLTGIGIDNYGIKKILPRLIVIAILVNLSYLLCQIAVDLSNIFGKGLEELLSSWSVGGATNTTTGGEQVGALALDVLLGGGSVMLFALFQGGGTMAGAGIWLGLAVVGLLITIVVAVAVLYLILFVREAGIILAIVVAPIAIVGYALPNTEKISKKWLDLFKALLVVYPICGAMVGAGKLAGSILASIGSDGMDVAAAVVQVAPFFFIPMLLKNSLSLMGNVGTKLSSFGKSWGQRGAKGLQGAVKGSDAMKSFQQRETERKTRFRAGINKDGTRKEVSSFGRLIRGGKSGMAKARSQYLRDRDTQYREDSLMGAGYDAAITAQEKKAQGDELSNEMVLLKHLTNDGANEDKLVEEFDAAMSEGNIAKARAATRLAGRRKDTASSFADKTVLNKNKKYNSEYLSKIAKEIAEGETSGNYRGASPLVFEYASQINNGNPNVRDRNNNKVMSYESWASNKANIHDALDHHVTTASELMGVQGKNLNTIVTLMDNGGMEQRDVERVSGLAKDIIRTNKENGTQIDTTKIKQIYQLAYGREAYLARMEADGVRKYIDSNTASSSGGGTTDGITISEDGSSATVDHSKNSNSTQNSLQQNNANPNNATRPGIIVGGNIEDSARQAKIDFDNSQRNNRNWPGNS